MGRIFSVLGSVVIGSLLGIIAGYYGRWVDAVISRVFDIMLAFPSILLAIGIVAVLGPSLKMRSLRSRSLTFRTSGVSFVRVY